MHPDAKLSVEPIGIDPLDPPDVVARALGISTQTLYNWRNTRSVDLGEIKINRMLRYPRSVWQAKVRGGLK